MRSRSLAGRLSSLAALASVVVGAFAVLAPAASAQADSCPNAELRRGSSAHLPDCRAYERVSAADKNGHDVWWQFSSIRLSPDGSRLAYRVPGGFGEAEGVDYPAQYVAQRGDAGWTTKSLMPRLGTDPLRTVPDYRIGYRWLSDDLRKGLLIEGKPTLTAGASPDVRNVYLRDVDSGSYTLMTPAPLVAPDPFTRLFYSPVAIEATADAEHVLFESNLALTADAPPGINLYEWTPAGVRLVGIDSGGNVIPGATAGRGGAVGSYTYEQWAGLDRAMSDDGSRIYFTTPADPGQIDGSMGQIFLRENATTTVEATRSRRTDCATSPGSCTGALDPDPAGPQAARYMTATPDGKRMFFLSCEKLTDDATAQVNGSTGCDMTLARNDLYMFDAETGDLADLTTSDLDGGRVTGVVGTSDDGKTVYFISRRGIGDGAYGLSVWREGEGVTPVAGQATVDERFNAPLDARPRQAQVSSNGRFVLFQSSVQLTGQPVGDWPQLYLYDAEATGNPIHCLSCRPDGAEPIGAGTVTPLQVGVATTTNYVARALSESGEVVFETANPLVAQDTNGKVDVYMYRDGETHLISTGRGEFDAHIGDVSTDRWTIAFATRGRLVRSDVDDLIDVYVARVGGGLTESGGGAREDCVGDACQGPPSGVPGADVPGSSVLRRGEGDDRASGSALALRVGAIGAAQRRTWARTGSVRITVRVAGPGSVRARALARVGGRRMVVAAATRRAARAGTVRLRLRLSTAARKELRRHARLRIRLVVSSARSPGASSRSLTLRKPSRGLKAGG